MARKSWSFVDPHIGAADLVCFLVVGVYLLVVWCYLVATRRLHSGLSLHQMIRHVGRWRQQAKARIVSLVRPSASSRKAA
jgi:hypothetical protein